MNNMKTLPTRQETRDGISKILVAWGMPTRQAAIDGIMSLISGRDEVIKQLLTEGIKDLSKETYILEDGIRVETYGYEETYNKALSDIKALIEKTI